MEGKVRVDESSSTKSVVLGEPYPRNVSASTMLFIGVSTGKSFVHKVFPKWLEIAKVQAQLRGVDLQPNSPKASYESVVNYIRNEEKILGALVTTHKTNIFNYTKSFFRYVSESADQLGEVGVIYKIDGQLACDAPDPMAQLYVLRNIVDQDHWRKSKASALIFGAGGAGVALAYNLLSQENGPMQVIITEVSTTRIEQVNKILKKYVNSGRAKIIKAQEGENELLLKSLAPGSLVANATGMGKDLPGNPISETAIFPEQGIIWEFNYRGDLQFLDMAKRQQAHRQLIVEDGWDYFVFGWTHVMSRVFSFEVTEDLSFKFLAAAKEARD